MEGLYILSVMSALASIILIANSYDKDSDIVSRVWCALFGILFAVLSIFGTCYISDNNYQNNNSYNNINNYNNYSY